MVLQVVSGWIVWLRALSQYLSNDRHKFGVVYGLLEKTLCPRADNALLVCAKVVTGYDYKWDYGERRNRLQPFDHDETVAGR
jgi:hypothetical protein